MIEFFFFRKLFIFCNTLFTTSLILLSLLKLCTICEIRKFYCGNTVTGHGFFKRFNPPFLVLSATQRTSRQLDEMSHSRYHTLSHLSLVQHSLPGSTTRTLSLGFCIDQHRQNSFLFAHPRRPENLKVPHLIRIYLVCFQLPLYSKQFMW